ncbi:hypothetical protein OC845_003433 [Tilletia horrida]|nr:hypothetical protein OC845_003433 [Tilletia horrida]
MILLTELELPKFVSGGGLLAAVTPGLVLPNLRILRARPRTAAALVEGRNAPRLSCIEFSPVQTQSELMLDEWILPHSEATRHITCLDIELDQEEVLDAVNELHGVFNAERFPSLVELSLCSTGTLEDDDHCATGNQHLRLTLERLRLLPSLRALRIEAMHLQPFPVQGPQVLDRAEAPPNLEYLTWHAPRFNCTQYFRAVRVPHERTLRRPRDVLKMQRLPASFRAHISEDGEWVQPGRLRQNNILFDHTVSPPILPPQA